MRQFVSHLCCVLVWWSWQEGSDCVPLFQHAALGHTAVKLRHKFIDMCVKSKAAKETPDVEGTGEQPLPLT